METEAQVKRTLEKGDLFHSDEGEGKGSGREESKLVSRALCATMKDPCFMVYIFFCIRQ